MRDNRLEITLPIEVAAAVHFWIEREEWEAMTPEQRQDRVSDAVNLAYLRLADDCIRVDPATTISAMLTEPELGGVDLSKVEVYDPEAA